MTVSVVFAGLVLLHITLLLYSRGIIRTASWRRVFLYLLMCGLIYDNLVLASGNIMSTPGMFPAGMFQAVSLPRFIFHAAILPFLTLFSLSTMQVVGVPASRNAIIIGAGVVFTGVALSYGMFYDVAGLKLGPVENYGHWRITNMEGHPPFATIATNIAAIIMGALVWRAKGPFWLFAGSGLAFILNTLAAGHDWSFISSNLVEVMFVFCLLQSERSLARFG